MFLLLETQFYYFFFLKPYPQTVSLSLFPTFCMAIILYHNIIMRLHEAKKLKKIFFSYTYDCLYQLFAFCYIYYYYYYVKFIVLLDTAFANWSVNMSLSLIRDSNIIYNKIFMTIIFISLYIYIYT